MEVVIKKIFFFLISIFLLLVVPQSVVIQAGENANEAVSQKILENGLVILAKETPPRDLVAIDVKIRAGSRFEAEYLGSGISHLLEHMVFKGTKTRPAGAIEREIKSYGGFLNGSVSSDLTDFNVSVPSSRLAETLAILKDMLLNAGIDKTELEKEREVVLKEIKLNNDEPQNRIIKLLNQTAYIRHPYKYPPIGYEDRFKAITRDDLVKYYNRMYVPNRIVISIVGGVNTNEAISRAENEFKDFRPPDYNDAWDVCQAEPAQIDKKRLSEEADTNLSYLAMGFHSTSLLDKDLFSMDVLAMVLGRGDNSRLNTALFKKMGLVHTISCWNYTPADPGLFVITAITDTDKTEKCEAAVLEEIGKIRNAAPDDYELETAKQMVISDFIFSLQTVESQANDISSNYILTGSYDFSRRYVEGVKNVSGEDVRRAANTYLRPESLTSIKLVPRGSGKVKENAAVSQTKDEIKKVELDNGLRLLLREDKKSPTISVTVAMFGGLMAENAANNGISNLAAEMLLKGTKTRKESEIEGAIERRGGNINAFSGSNSFGLNLRLLKEDFDADMAILKDVLTDSVFPQDELERQKILTMAMLKEEDDDIFQRGFNLLTEGLFAPSPYALRYLGTDTSLGSLKREDVVKFYETYCVPNNMVISVSGDIESAAVADKMKVLLGPLQKKPLELPLQGAPQPGKVETKILKMRKDQSLVLLGFRTISIKDADRYALDVMGSVLSGYSGRLFSDLRGKQSLAYTLGCVQKLGFETGYLAFYVATIKDKIPQVKKALIEEIGRISQEDAGDEELALAKSELITRNAIASQTNGFFATTSAMDELYTLGYGNLYKYKEEIEKVTKEDIKRVAKKYLDLNAGVEVLIEAASDDILNL